MKKITFMVLATAGVTFLASDSALAQNDSQGGGFSLEAMLQQKQEERDCEAKCTKTMDDQIASLAKDSDYMKKYNNIIGDQSECAAKCLGTLAEH